MNIDFKTLLTEALKNEVKIIVTGRSGWGKSEMIHQVAEELNLELIDFRLSEVLPEDIIGIPKIKDSYYEYAPPKWLYEVINNPDKKYLLFLDEITQGTPEVLNICYKIFDKVTKIGEHTLKNVSVVGATNYSEESNYLNKLPEPLKNRALMIELDHKKDVAAGYLIKKYNLEEVLLPDIALAIEKTNPRRVDTGIKLLLNKASKELCIHILTHIGYNALKILESYVSLEEDSLGNFEKAKNNISLGRVFYNKKIYKITDKKSLYKVYDLTDEEIFILENDYTLELESILANTDKTLRESILTDYVIFNYKKIPKKEYRSFYESLDFNIIILIRRMSLGIQETEFIIKFCKEVLNQTEKEVLKRILSLRSIPLSTMEKYREHLPYDLLIERPYLMTPAKNEAFKVELEEARNNKEGNI